MPEADRQRFVANIRRETQRIQELILTMMELAALGQRAAAKGIEPVSLRPLLRSWQPAPGQHGMTLAEAYCVSAGEAAAGGDTVWSR